MSLHQSWHRSLKNRVFAGVCGGLAETWGSDPNLIRLFWVLFALWTRAAGVILYLVAALLLPVGESGTVQEENPNPDQDQDQVIDIGKPDAKPSSRRTQQWIGIMLMLAGGYWLVERFLPNIMDEVRKVAFPLIIIGLGLWLVLREKRGEGD